MARVYISYKSNDVELAKSVASALKNRKHTVLIDLDLLKPKDEWRAKLADALASCDAFVTLITNNSIGASYPMSEIGAARALKKPIIPVLIGGVGLPNFIGDIFYISENFGSGSKAAGMKRIVNKIDEQIATFSGSNVFIVHGQNEAKKLELKDLLRTLGVNPVILHEQDDRGLTIIEKFEHYAPQCSFAFVLLTPDDKQDIGSKAEDKWRARQNVIMELGWFMAKLGRERVALLHKGEVEIPTDISGVIYLKFENSVAEVATQIRQRLRGANLIQ